MKTFNLLFIVTCAMVSVVYGTKNKEIVSCNMCVDPNVVTLPDARLTVWNVFAIWPITVSCRHRNEKFLAGIGKKKCIYFQGRTDDKMICGCAPQ
jgi:hypothetical protein